MYLNKVKTEGFPTKLEERNKHIFTREGSTLEPYNRT